MKKVLTLFLAVCMLISIIPMAVSAETIIEPSKPSVSIPENITTVYVGGTNANDSNDGTANAPYATFEKAYNAAITANGTADRKIFVQGDIKAFPDAYDKLISYEAAHYLLGDYDGGTVYVCGDSNDVPAIDLATSSTSLESKMACAFTLGADMVFDSIKFDSSDEKNKFICAALHDLTLGDNILNGQGNLTVNGTVFKSTNDKTPNTTYDDKLSAQMDADDTDKVIISIYSGTYHTIVAGCRATSTKCACDHSNPIVLNIYGGECTSKINASNGSINSQNITLNIYDAKLADSVKIASDNTSITATLNLYDASLDGNIGTGLDVINRYYAVYAGVQNTAVNTDTTDDIPDNTYSVRFVGVIDSLDYEEVGFEISTAANGEITGGRCEKLYTSVVGDGDDYTASELGGNYIFAYAIKDIPTSVGTVTFTVKPYYVVKVNEVPTTYYGTAYTVTYNAEGYVSSSAIAN